MISGSKGRGRLRALLPGLGSIISPTTGLSQTRGGQRDPDSRALKGHPRCGS